MYWLIGILLLLLLCIIILLFSRLRVSISYVHQSGNDQCTIRIRLFKGWIHYTWEIPFNKTDVADEDVHLQFRTDVEVGHQEKQKDKEVTISTESLIKRAHETKEIIDSVFQFSRIVRQFFKAVSVEEFHWESMLGTGDAASTGIFSGLLWTIKGSIAGFLSTSTRLVTPPILEVTPAFQKIVLTTQLQCMFSFRIGKAMLAAYLIAKNWKGRKQHVRTSNPGFDANGNGKY